LLVVVNIIKGISEYESGVKLFM